MAVYVGPRISPINPLSLGQPSVYYQTFDTNFLSPTNPNNGTPINFMYRYNDNNYQLTGATAELGFSTNFTGGGLKPAEFTNLNGYNMLYFNGPTGDTQTWNEVTGSTYVSNFDLDFTRFPNYSFTVYVVAKPITGNSTTQFIFRNQNVGPNTRGCALRILSNPPRVNLLTARDAGPSYRQILNINIEENNNVGEFDTKDLRIFSVRAQDPLNLVNTAAYSYVNGVQTTAVTQTNLATESVALPRLAIGGSVFSDNINVVPGYKGYLAEVIIFNTMHDLDTHNRVVDFLKNKWGIT